MSAARNPVRRDVRLPAEWEPHAATWITWPQNPCDWPGKFQPMPWAFAEIIRKIANAEPGDGLSGRTRLFLWLGPANWVFWIISRFSTPERNRKLS